MSEWTNSSVCSTRWTHMKKKANSSSELIVDFHQSTSHWTNFIFEEIVQLKVFLWFDCSSRNFWSGAGKSFCTYDQRLSPNWASSKTTSLKLSVKVPIDNCHVPKTFFYCNSLRSWLFLCNMVPWNWQIEVGKFFCSIANLNFSWYFG